MRLLFAAAALFYGVFVWRSGFAIGNTVYFSLFDDAMISMTYARNLAEGHGLVWFPGAKPVEGYTNLLWTLGMALVHAAGVGEAKASLVVMLAGAALLLVNGWVVYRLACALTDTRAVALAAAFLTLFSYPLVFWTLRGMEVGCLTLVANASLLLAVGLDRRAPTRGLAWIFLWLTLGILLRPDAAVIVAVVGAYLMLVLPGRDRWRVPLFAAPVALAFLAHTAFRISYYGEVLPNTYYQKLGGVGLLMRSLRGLLVLLDATTYHLLPLFLVLLVGAPWILRDRRLGLLTAFFLAQCAYSIWVGGDAWEWMYHANRFLTVGLPSALVAALVVVERHWRAPAERHPRWESVVTLGLVWVVLFVALVHDTAGFRWIGGCIAALLLMSLPALGLRRRVARALPPLSPARGVWASAVAIFLFMNGWHLSRWAAHGPVHWPDDVRNTRLALTLRQVTTPDAQIAVTWAGAPCYFSRRPCVDLLGLNDPVIARGPAHLRTFHPGHMKWNYDYSIGELRPDVVVTLLHGDDPYHHTLQELGYRHVKPLGYLREGSPRIRWSRIAPP